MREGGGRRERQLQACVLGKAKYSSGKPPTRAANAQQVRSRRTVVDVGNHALRMAGANGRERAGGESPSRRWLRRLPLPPPPPLVLPPFDKAINARLLLPMPTMLRMFHGKSILSLCACEGGRGACAIRQGQGGNRVGNRNRCCQSCRGACSRQQQCPCSAQAPGSNPLCLCCCCCSGLHTTDISDPHILLCRGQHVPDLERACPSVRVEREGSSVCVSVLQHRWW